MQASEIIRSVENAGGELWLSGASLAYRLPETASPLLEQLRARKAEVLELLRQRPPLPAGVRLVRWEPIAAPVRLNRWAVVIDTDRFIRTTLEQVAARLTGRDWRAGNWSLRELVERLETVGVTIALVKDSGRVQ
jgi:hypothetical protein